ncbi:TRAP transporter small permease subunit [Ectothiorhodospira sp. BSL-9]|uniref:TRAP transporter small permease subunit n=1 Tax=Ectothiorhodospira sp. BSL-9 TaxID=1442136 RepID=UPI0007B42A84|nr:TRAP transporter small permease subunit [Ectothiorhodospira sp. BSL-9]ANB01563.1 C4-dicarboxylate ABC transporter permease [Ectothiorhodospira sp. BSL-9]
MSRLLLRIERALNQVTRLAGWIAAISMAALVLLVFANMAARYALGMGSVWSQELEWYVLSLTVMTGIAYAMRSDEHVRVDVFSHHLSRVGKLWLDGITMLLVAIPVSLLVLYYTWPFVQISYVRGEGSPNAGGMPWLFLPKAMILVGFALILIESLRQLLRIGRRLVFHYRHARRHHAGSADHAA